MVRRAPRAFIAHPVLWTMIELLLLALPDSGATLGAGSTNPQITWTRSRLTGTRFGPVVAKVWC